MDVGLERVNFESHTFSLSGSHNIFMKALHKLRPGAHQYCLEARLRILLFISSSFNPLSRGLDERGSHFRLEKNVIKQDALTAHAHNGFQETQERRPMRFCEDSTILHKNVS